MPDTTAITTTLSAPRGRAAARPAPATAAQRNAEPAKPATTAKPTARPKSAVPAKRSGTKGGRITIAVLAGLALGLVTLMIYGFAKPSGPWPFDRPEAKLPSLQAKHTLY
jgi:hypothetical protein